jgi:hypothetical protein
MRSTCCTRESCCVCNAASQLPPGIALLAAITTCQAGLPQPIWEAAVQGQGSKGGLLLLARVDSSSGLVRVWVPPLGHAPPICREQMEAAEAMAAESAAARENMVVAA